METKDKFIFVCVTTDSGEYFAGRKDDIDMLIRQYEENPDEDLPFTTVAKIKEPPQGLPIGFPEQLIQWYDTKQMPGRRVIDGGVMAIIQFLQNGFRIS